MRRNRGQQSYRNWRVASKAFGFQTVECSSDSIVQKNRHVASSWKCSVTKPETTKLPEIVCRFESVRNSNCNVLLRFHCTKEAVSSSLLEEFCNETERNEFTGSGVLLSKCLNFRQVSDCWSDSIMRNTRSVVCPPKCFAMKREAVTQPEVVCRFPIGSGVSLPYRKWCVASKTPECWSD